MFLLYLHANSVTNAKAGSNLDRGGATQSVTSCGIEFTMNDLYAVEELQGQPQLFRLIVRSVMDTAVICLYLIS